MKKFLGLVLLIFTLIGCSSGSRDKNSPSSIKLTDLSGHSINLDEFKGKMVFINFWATWCKPCLQEMPSIFRAREKLEKEGWVFLIASDESPETIEEFLRNKKWQMTSLHMESNYTDIGIFALPSTYILDTLGNTVLTESGMRNWDTSEMLDKLRKSRHTSLSIK